MRRLLITLACCAALPVEAHAAGPTTTLADVSSSGVQANTAASSGAVSPNGRYVAFVSAATNLDASGTTGVFVRDRLRLQTRRVSDPARSAGSPQISGDGSTLLFLSSDAAGQRLFRHDLASGTTGPVPGPAPSGSPCTVGYVPATLSDDGRAVAYCGAGRIYLSVGATAREVTRLPSGTPLNDYSYDAAISGDGQWVAFVTQSTNWSTPADADGYRDVVLWHASDGSFTNVSVGNGNAAPNLHSSTPAVSRDGCVVAFYSDATNLVAGDPGMPNKVFARDRCGGQTEFASVSNAAAATKGVPPVTLSPDGCRVTYLAPAGASAQQRDRCLGATQRLDLSTAGEAGNGATTQAYLSGGTARYVALTSQSTNLVTSDANGATADVFVRDLGTNTPPTAAVGVAVAGSTVVADATTSADPDGYVLSGSILFGDGTETQAGLQASHTYARAGTYSVIATVTDADGVSATRSVPVTVGPPATTPGAPGTSADSGSSRSPAAVKLKLDRLSLSRKRFRGTAKLTLRLSAPARVTLTFADAVRRGKRTRYVKVKTLARSLPAGTSTVSVGAGLRIGKHRLTVTAVARDGSAATPRTLSFTTLKPKARI